MKHLTRSIVASATLVIAACSQPAPAPLSEGNWTLDGGASSIAFVSVKASDIGEAHGFKIINGSVSPQGEAELTIDLASVDTGIEIRDERMREFLFETGAFPQATVTAQIDPASFADMAVGESKALPLVATLDLRGASTQVETEAEVLRAGPDTVIVSNARPIILDAGALGLTDGLAKLQELAGLPSISAAVPVTFSLTYTR